ncbi:hypothetical protein [Deinococcus aerophilus]|uniref:hypothetical protein n=1 Tax=Deinococcus aerophilus TaxID=522488 RepID=UPI001E49FF96|nr:hypothetical protein [Deinococcus aerophilus]
MRTPEEASAARWSLASRPGSLAWLLKKQLLWQWRSLSSGQRRWLFMVFVVVVLGMVGGFVVLRPVLSRLSLNGPLPDAALGPVLLAQTVLLMLMLSAAVRAALSALFTRGDLDLLLHSPLPARVVLTSRALGVAVSAALASALFVVPALLLLLVLGVWRGGLGLPLWWVCAALLAASAGLWLTLGLVRVLGVRRTRTVSSVFGALFGAGLFLAIQWGSLGGDRASFLQTVFASVVPGRGNWPGPEGLLWFAARAAWLEPWPTLALLGLSVTVFGGSVLVLTRQFTYGIQELAAPPGGRRPRPAAADTGLHFASGPRATLLKEWRLIGRDSELLSRTLLQLVYLVPLLFSVTRVGGLRAAGGTGVVLLTASLAAALAHLTLNAEDAPDLLLSAPRRPAALRRDKWLAAVLPTALVGALILAVLTWQGALSILHTFVLVPLLLLGTGGTALMVLWQPLPTRRADAFQRGHRAPVLNTLLALLFQAGLSATAFAVSGGAVWGVATLALALVVLGVAFGLRRSDVR